MSRFTFRSGAAIAAATLFGVVLTTAAASAVEQTATTTQTQPTAVTIAHEHRALERSEARIREMHDRLRITPAQEDSWNKVAKVMRDNDAAFRVTVGERYRDAKPMSAVDDLKSFQIIADEHSSGLKKLVPAFESLYGAMTPDQQKRADGVFAHRGRHAFN